MAIPQSRVLHRSLRETPPKAVGGEGVWLFAEDGRKVLDASGGAAVSCLGHQHPRVLAAMAKQSEKLVYAHTAFFSSEPAEELAEQLVGHEPGGRAYVYFVSGGSEAIEASIKIARQYFLEAGQPQRQRFIARRQSYHGNTLGALAAGGNAWRREPYQPLLSSAFSHVTPAFAYHEKRDDESEKDFVARLAAELDAEFMRLGPDTVAAFIAEPVVGATGGAVTAPEGYISSMLGANRRSTRSCSSSARSRSKLRGYLPRSSLAPNWMGFTKRETATRSHCAFAARTRERWPSWSAPMVGTRPRRLLSDGGPRLAARISSMVRQILIARERTTPQVHGTQSMSTCMLSRAPATKARF